MISNKDTLLKQNGILMEIVLVKPRRPVLVILLVRQNVSGDTVPGGDFSSPKVIFGRAFLTVTGGTRFWLFFAILETTRQPNQEKKLMSINYTPRRLSPCILFLSGLSHSTLKTQNKIWVL